MPGVHTGQLQIALKVQLRVTPGNLARDFCLVQKMSYLRDQKKKKKVLISSRLILFSQSFFGSYLHFLHQRGVWDAQKATRRKCLQVQRYLYCELEPIFTLVVQTGCLFHCVSPWVDYLSGKTCQLWNCPHVIDPGLHIRSSVLVPYSPNPLSWSRTGPLVFQQKKILHGTIIFMTGFSTKPFYVRSFKPRTESE